MFGIITSFYVISRHCVTKTLGWRLHFHMVSVEARYPRSLSLMENKTFSAVDLIRT